MTSPPRLSSRERSLICTLADPESQPPDPENLLATDANRLAAIIEHHRIGTIARRHLKALGSDLPPAYHEMVTSHTEIDLGAAAIALDLEARGRTICEALVKRGIAHALVKGPVFANDLYTDPAARTFTDVDILVSPDGLQAAGRALLELGYVQSVKHRFDRSIANEEEKWVAPEKPWVLIELHTDLVHMRALRRRVRYDLVTHSLTYGLDPQIGGKPNRPMAGHLVLAAIHAAAGHKFHVLNLVVDALQAVRGLAEADIDHLREIVPQTRVGLELAQTLAVVGSLFPHSVRALTDKLMARLELPRPSALVLGNQVLDTYGDRQRLSHIRRHLFRQKQLFWPR